MDLGLQGKNALITGGSIGIGEAIALALAQEGVRVGICSRDLERGEASAAAAAAESDGTVRAFQADVSKESDINRLASEVTESLGSVDILINNAGTGSEETIIDAPDAKWQYYWDLHVMAAVRLSRALVPGMRGRDGVIINNASICARQPLYYEPIYNTTKAALVMMTKCLANELIPADHNEDGKWDIKSLYPAALLDDIYLPRFFVCIGPSQGQFISISR